MATSTLKILRQGFGGRACQDEVKIHIELAPPPVLTSAHPGSREPGETSPMAAAPWSSSTCKQCEPTRKQRRWRHTSRLASTSPLYGIPGAVSSCPLPVPTAYHLRPSGQFCGTPLMLRTWIYRQNTSSLLSPESILPRYPCAVALALLALAGCPTQSWRSCDQTIRQSDPPIPTNSGGRLNFLPSLLATLRSVYGQPSRGFREGEDISHS